MDIVHELRRIADAFERNGIEYALCGGLAMAVYNLPRATLDIDLLIRSESLPQAREAAGRLGFTLAAAPMSFAKGDVHIHRLCRIDPETGQELVLDLLLTTQALADIWSMRQTLPWEGGVLSVLSPEGLIRLKSRRGNDRDRDDIAHLRRLCDED